MIATSASSWAYLILLLLIYLDASVLNNLMSKYAYYMEVINRGSVSDEDLVSSDDAVNKS